MNSVPVFQKNDISDDSIEFTNEKEIIKEGKEEFEMSDTEDDMTQEDEEDASQKEAPRNLRRRNLETNCEVKKSKNLKRPIASRKIEKLYWKEKQLLLF